MDRRVKYTKKVIKDTFISLLEEKEIKKITVSELCSIADINRATFYRYYLDIYDLYDKIQDEFVTELKNIIINNHDKRISTGILVKSILEALLKEKKLSKIIFNKKNNLLFMDDIIDLSYKYGRKVWLEKNPNLTEKDIEYASVFLFNAALGVINFWIENDFDGEPEVIGNMIEQLTKHGISKYIAN